MSDQDQRAGVRRDTEFRLARLAALLGCAADVFTDGAHAPREVEQLRDLIALWDAIDDPDHRDQLIAFMRKMANA